jgi:hypothetical protein
MNELVECLSLEERTSIGEEKLERNQSRARELRWGVGVSGLEEWEGRGRGVGERPREPGKKPKLDKDSLTANTPRLRNLGFHLRRRSCLFLVTGTGATGFTRCHRQKAIAIGKFHRESGIGAQLLPARMQIFTRRS